jgi:hypothetical protein
MAILEIDFDKDKHCDVNKLLTEVNKQLTSINKLLIHLKKTMCTAKLLQIGSKSTN